MLGGIVTQIKFVFEAQVAGKLAYEIIDYKAEVQTNPNGKVLPKEEIKGEIVFKNVSFRYPTR